MTRPFLSAILTALLVTSHAAANVSFVDNRKKALRYCTAMAMADRQAELHYLEGAAGLSANNDAAIDAMLDATLEAEGQPVTAETRFQLYRELSDDLVPLTDAIVAVSMHGEMDELGISVGEVMAACQGLTGDIAHSDALFDF